MFASFQSFLDGPVDVDDFYEFTKRPPPPPQPGFQYSDQESIKVNMSMNIENEIVTRGKITDQQQILSQSLDYPEIVQIQRGNSPSKQIPYSLDTTSISQFNNNINLAPYERLYYSGMQRKASRERKTQQQQQSRVEQELSQCQNVPKISIISSEVAKTLTKRPKNSGGDFLNYSMEWQKMRDAKIKQQKKLQETKILEEQRPLLMSDDRKLPDNYKGPISGYYDRVNQFFHKKRQNMEQSMLKPIGIPQINKRYEPYREDSQFETVIEKHHRSKSREGTSSQISIEERLLKKGQDYKRNLNQKRHEQVKEMIKNGPTFQPKLISNNEQYLKNKRQSEEEQVKNEVGVGNHFYYEAMVFLMNKQTRILDHQKMQNLIPKVPQINQKSKEMCDQMARKPIHERLTTSQKQKLQNEQQEQKKQEDPEVKERKKAKVSDFIKRNYEKELKQRELKLEKAKESQSMDKLKEQGINFKPTLSEGTLTLMTDRKKQSPTFEDLYREAKIKAQKKKDMIEKFKKEQEAKELQNATFKPQINNQPKITIQEKLQKDQPKTPDSYSQMNKQKAQQKEKPSSYLQMHFKKEIKQQQVIQNDKQTKMQQLNNVNVNSFFNQDLSHIQASTKELVQPNNNAIFIEGSQYQQLQQSLIVKSDSKSSIGTDPKTVSKPILNHNEERRNSELNRTIESNLLDFNEDRFFEETKTLMEKNMNKSQRSSISKDQYQQQMYYAGTLASSEKKPYGGTNDVIEGFLNDMQNAAHTQSTGMGSQPIEKVIEDARKALMEYDENSFEQVTPNQNFGVSKQKMNSFEEQYNDEIDSHIDSILKQQNSTSQPLITPLKPKPSQNEITPQQQQQHQYILGSSSSNHAIHEEDQSEYEQMPQQIIEPLPSQNDIIPFNNGIQNMNKTLSLIEEENEDEYFTNDYDRHSSHHTLGDTRKQNLDVELKSINEQIEKETSVNKSNMSINQENLPEIVKDIEAMERDFTKFLENIYN